MSVLPVPDSSPISDHSRPRQYLWDLGFVAVMIVLWWLWLYDPVARIWPVGFDTIRDAAGAENVLAGQWFRDPTIAGQIYWYAPLGPILMAGISKLTGVQPLMLYSTSILWLNVLLPIGWYVLARCCWDRPTAIAAVLLIWLGSRWWIDTIALPMASVHGVILLILTLSAWATCLKHGRLSVIGVGVLLGLCTWMHIISGIIAAAAIGVHALLLRFVPGEEPRADEHGRHGRATHRASGPSKPIHQVVIVAAVCAMLVAPLAWHLARLPRVNLHPIEYVAAEMLDPAYVFQLDTPLVITLAVVGAVMTWRSRNQTVGIVLAYAVVGLVGQAIGYARHWFGAAIPILIPHEFQWNFQIAVGLLAAVGAGYVGWWIGGSRRFAERVRPRQRALVMLVVVAVAVGTALPGAIRSEPRLWRSIRPILGSSVVEAVDWIRSHTSINDVFFAPPPHDWMLVAGATGRKIVAPPEGHTHISIAPEQRIEDATRALATSDPETYYEFLTKYGVHYVLVPADEDEELLERWSAWEYLEPAFRTSTGTVTILQVVPQ